MLGQLRSSSMPSLTLCRSIQRDLRKPQCSSAGIEPAPRSIASGCEPREEVFGPLCCAHILGYFTRRRNAGADHTSLHTEKGGEAPVYLQTERGLSNPGASSV